MQIRIALLRAVNVGGTGKIRMDELKEMLHGSGFLNPQTYIQSGNIVFGAESADTALVRNKMEEGIERRFGFHVDVIIRTPEELRRILERNPFAERSGMEPAKLLIMFFDRPAEETAQDKAREIPTVPDELHYTANHFYAYFPDGMGRSKLQTNRILKTLGVLGTARNLNSVMKLLEMADAFTGS